MSDDKPHRIPSFRELATSFAEKTRIETAADNQAVISITERTYAAITSLVPSRPWEIMTNQSRSKGSKSDRAETLSESSGNNTWKILRDIPEDRKTKITFKNNRASSVLVIILEKVNPGASPGGCYHIVLKAGKKGARNIPYNAVISIAEINDDDDTVGVLVMRKLLIKLLENYTITIGIQDIDETLDRIKFEDLSSV